MIPTLSICIPTADKGHSRLMRWLVESALYKALVWTVVSVVGNLWRCFRTTESWVARCYCSCPVFFRCGRERGVCKEDIYNANLLF